uniref:Uncharacterized protein n=1 Tax=Octopus bimaculoides TaxID=37653 RepID=A0A0L8GL09_OCTBM
MVVCDLYENQLLFKQSTFLTLPGIYFIDLGGIRTQNVAVAQRFLHRSLRPFVMNSYRTIVVW